MGQVSVSVVCCAPRAGFCVSLPSRREKGAPEGSYSDFFLSRLLCGLTPAPACPSAGHVPSHPGLSFPEKTRQEAVSALPFPGGWEGIESSPRPVLTPPQAEPGSRVPVSPPLPQTLLLPQLGALFTGACLELGWEPSSPALWHLLCWPPTPFRTTSWITSVHGLCGGQAWLPLCCPRAPCSLPRLDPGWASPGRRK